MKLASPSFPKNNVSQTTNFLCYGLSLVIILMVVPQLMTMEKFLPMIENYQLPGGLQITKLVAFLSATCGIFSLPFLLRMRLSPLFRICSALSLAVFTFLWVFLGVWIVVKDPPLIGTGIAGGLLKFIPGDFVLPFALALCLLAVYVTWLLRKDLHLKRK